jgi:hypothetical protein
LHAAPTAFARRCCKDGNHQERHRIRWEKATYVDRMIEIYFKMKNNLMAKFGQEWFNNKIPETVAMLPDGNKSLLQKDDDIATINHDDEIASSVDGK